MSLAGNNGVIFCDFGKSKTVYKFSFVIWRHDVISFESLETVAMEGCLKVSARLGIFSAPGLLAVLYQFFSNPSKRLPN